MSQIRPMPPGGGDDQTRVRPVPPMSAEGDGGAPSPSASPIPGIDPNNPLAAHILRGMDTLAPEDVAALAQGITPPMAAALSKILPEVSALWDFFASDAGPEQMGGGAPAGGMPPGAGPAMPAGGGMGGAPRPTTGLSRINAPPRMG